MRILTLILCSIVVTACSSSPPAGGCTSNAECEAGWLCVDDQCAKLCLTQSDCPSGLVCLGDTCAPTSGGPLPQIQGVSGNDPGALTSIVDGLVVTGANLGDAVFELRDSTAGVVLTARNRQANSAELVLPADVVSGDYVLVATNAAGSAQQSITLTLPELTPDVLLSRINSASGEVSISRLPVGTSATDVAPGNHNHDGAYAPSGHDHNAAYYPRAEADTTFYDRADADSTFAGLRDLAEGRNLINNGDLAGGLSGWSVDPISSGTGLSLATGVGGPAGDRALRNNSSQVLWVTNDTWVPIDPRKTYRAKYSIRITSAGTIGTTYLAVRLRNSAGAEIGNTGCGGNWWNYPVSGLTPLDTNWRTYDGLVGAGTRCTFPAGATTATLAFIVNYNGLVVGDRTYDVQGLGLYEAQEPSSWSPFPYAAGVYNYAGDYQVAQYRRLGDTVCVRGLTRMAAAIPAGQLLGTLPAGFHPPGRLIFFQAGHDNGERVDVLTNGQIYNITTDGEIWTSLDGICFSTTP